MYGIENPVAYILGTVVFAELLVASEEQRLGSS